MKLIEINEHALLLIDGLGLNCAQTLDKLDLPTKKDQL